MHGIRYLVIAVGGPDEADNATDEDVESLKDFIEDRLGPMITVTALSERVSNKVTLALLQEKGVL